MNDLVTDLSDLSDSDKKPAMQRLGRILSIAGVIWFLAVIAANMGLFRSLPFDAFIGGTLFLPLGLMFAGRVLRRRSRDIEVLMEDEPPPPPPRREQPPRRPPTVVALPEPEPVATEELEAILGFEESDVGAEKEESLSDFSTPSTDPRVKSSTDMIEEAKRRLRSDS